MERHSEVRQEPLPLFVTAVIIPAKTSIGGTAGFARRYPLGFAGAVILIIVAFLAIAAPVVTTQDPTEVNLGEFTQDPSWSHPLGTDYQGRDILARVIYGGRASLEVSVLSVLLGTTFGAIWGIASGYMGGRFDMISQRSWMFSWPSQP